MNKIEAFYDNSAHREWQRFERHRTEFAITRRALAEFLPPPPARILDCGGGPGRYSILLAQLGYTVTLLDLSSGNLELARQKAQEAGVEIEAFVHGNALDLSQFQDASFDAVLLLGPLYHLLRPEDRDQAAREAMRVMRPKGALFAGFITLYAPLRDAIAKGYLEHFSSHPALVRDLLEHGTNVQEEEDGFTDAWFARPQEVAPWVERLGLKTTALMAVEGLSAGHEQHINAAAPVVFEYWVDLQYQLSRDPALLGAADHLLYVGVK